MASTSSALHGRRGGSALAAAAVNALASDGMKPWLAVIGIGEDGLAGLAPAARALVETAEVLVGGARHLAMVPQGGAERIVWQRPLAATIAAIAARRGRRVAVLASGDPMWYGVGVTLARRFPREEMTIMPQPSAFSLAAARLGWPLADCAAISLHGRPLDALRLHLAPGRRMLVLSEDGATPRAVAELLTGLGWGPSRLTVLAHLGGAARPSSPTRRSPGAIGGFPTSTRSRSPAAPARAPEHCRGSPACPTMSSSMTAS